MLHRRLLLYCSLFHFCVSPFLDMKMSKFIKVYFHPEECAVVLDGKASGVQVNTVPAAQVPYTLSLTVQVSSTHPVSKVQSNCPLDPLQYVDTEKTQSTVGILLTCLLCGSVLKSSVLMFDMSNKNRSSWQLDINLTEMWSC